MIFFAWTMLILWPVIAIILFRVLSPQIALCTTLLGGYLLLPNAVEFDLPLLPPLNKVTIATLAALVMTVVTVSRKRVTVAMPAGWISGNLVILTLSVVMIIGMVGTVITNGDPLQYGFRELPGLRNYEVISELIRTIILLLPFFLARKLLATPEGHRVLLVVLVISAAAYCFPSLWEVRMSPQLHRQIYGLFPHSFVQHMRSDGFRPLVFMQHGLSLSIFLACATIAVCALYRSTHDDTRWGYPLLLMWLMFTLVLSKSLGALLIACVFVPVVLFLAPRLQLLFALCVALIVLVYPVLRMSDLIPVDQIMNFANSISPERAASLQTRLSNEDALMAKVQERPWFGWGGWGRSRVYSEWGRDITLVDGAWIGELGGGGWFRYFTLFGFLCLPIVGLFLKRRECADLFSISLALVLTAKLIDLLPNSGIDAIYLMMAGALTGRLELGAAAVSRTRAELQSAEQVVRPGYARDQNGAPAGRRGATAPRYARSFPDLGPDRTPAAKPASGYSRTSKPGSRK